MEFGKKSTFGYKVVDSSSDWTHYIVKAEYLDQLMDEHKDLKEYVDNLERELKQAEEKNNKLQKELTDIRSKSEGNLFRAKRMMDEAEKLEQEAEEIRSEQKIEVENIRRIYKETINAARGLKPKKKHTGYCVISSTEKVYRYKDAYGKLQDNLLWETILEMPYTVDFEPEKIKRLFLEDLFIPDENERWKIGEIGINATYFADEENMIEGKFEEIIVDYNWGERDEYKQYNVVFEPQIKANYRTGYWEIIFYHTKPLKNVPATWRRGNYS